AAVLAAMGAFVYARVDSALVDSVQQGLRNQASDGAARLRTGGPLLDNDLDDGGLLAQLVDSRGRILQASDLPAGARLLDADDTDGVFTRGPIFRTVSVAGRHGDWRVFATPIRLHGRTEVLVLARSLEAREESLDRLAKELLIAGPIALLLASLAGYL